MTKVTVLGSSGSIGKSALDVIRNSPDLEVYGLSVYSNIALLEEQVKQFNPVAVAVSEEVAAESFREICKQKGYGVEVLSGEEGVSLLAGREDSDIVLVGVVGNAGIEPTLSAIEAGKTIALANKEALVSAGELIIKKASEKNVKILPVDSEHSAIFQCLQGYLPEQVNKLILTASGGAFRGMSRAVINEMKARNALKHPTWDMGAKITIDSATLMNKGLEVIEACWLFGVRPEEIDVIVHPQSIIHSMVEFKDGSLLAQMGPPDMRYPISYALNYPHRKENSFPKLNLLEVGSLTFEQPDYQTFPCLGLARRAIEVGGTAPCVLNEANHELVNLYLDDKIGFYDISGIIEQALNAYNPIFDYSYEDLASARKWAREFVKQKTQK